MDDPYAPYSKFTVMSGGHLYDEDGEVPDDDQALINARYTLAKSIEIDAQPVASMVHTQRDCIPQYVVGHHDKLKRIDHAVQLAFPHKVGLLGNSYLGVGINDVLYQARMAAWEMAQSGVVRPMHGFVHV
jgi:oxygen-dependent protoporphyrinogen oxidase